MNTTSIEELEDRVFEVLGFVASEMEGLEETHPDKSATAGTAAITWVVAMQLAIDAPDAWARLLAARVGSVASGKNDEGPFPIELAHWIAALPDSGEVGEYLSTMRTLNDLRHRD